MRDEPLIGQTLGTRYRVEAFVDQGAMGQIFRAVDTRLEFRQVALKVLKPDTPTDQIARFKREALLTGGLSSPHLTRCSDFGVLPDGRAWLVMEYLHGQSLAELLVSRGRLPLGRALKIVDGILAGLEAAHAAGVVHRDLKPSNVFVVEEPGVSDHAKLLDFGFAKVYGGEAPALDVTGEERIVVGTVSYMAPEQLRGQDTDHRADLFSAGVLLFHMLTGQLPYDTKGPAASMLTAAKFRVLNLNDPPRKLTEMDAAFEGLEALEVVLAQAMAVDPAARPESAGALRRALADAIKVTAPTAAVASPGQGAAQWRTSGSGLHPLDVPKGAEPFADEAPSGLLAAGGDRAHPVVLWGGLLVLLCVGGYFIWRATAG